MELDDTICHCYGVSYRKLRSFARRRRLSRPSQMSECLGAGTGCGWCVPFLKSIFEAAGKEDPAAGPPGLTAEAYAQARQAYIQSGRQRHTF